MVSSNKGIALPGHVGPGCKSRRRILKLSRTPISKESPTYDQVAVCSNQLGMRRDGAPGKRLGLSGSLAPPGLPEVLSEALDLRRVLQPAFLLCGQRRKLGEFWQSRVHTIPGRRIHGPNIHLWPKPTRVVQGGRLDSNQLRSSVVRCEYRRTACLAE
jgi:hypothetical protein